jgi:hypothetical protein
MTMIESELTEDEEQLLEAKAQLKLTKEQREKKREAKVRSYGILDRNNSRKKERHEWIKRNCTCGAVKEQRGLHAETCAVVLDARSRRK